MRERVGGKNTIGLTAAVLKKPHKANFTFTDINSFGNIMAHNLMSYKKEYTMKQ